MAHFVDSYAERANEILRDFARTLFFKQEILEVPGLLTALLITYEGVRDDTRETHSHMPWGEFLKRMSAVKADWRSFDRAMMEKLAATPERGISGWEGRTIYFIKGGSHPEQWTSAAADSNVMPVLLAKFHLWGPLIQIQAEQLRQSVPVGNAHFREYEDAVRTIFTFLFRKELGVGQAQSRTEPENEGIEIRDIVFANRADSGFWKDIKDKYSASEIVVDAKNTDDLKREGLRQLYCYLKPALGFWGFIVCRTPPSALIQAFNRTLYKNFSQQRGVLILCDDDLRRMVQISNRGGSASSYLQDKMSEFVRSI